MRILALIALIRKEKTNRRASKSLLKTNKTNKITFKSIKMLGLVGRKALLYACTAAITLVSAFVHYVTGNATIRLSIAIPDVARIRRFVAHWFVVCFKADFVSPSLLGIYLLHLYTML